MDVQETSGEDGGVADDTYAEPDYSDTGGGGDSGGDGSGGEGSGGASTGPSVVGDESMGMDVRQPIVCSTCGGSGGGRVPSGPARPPTSFTVSDVVSLAPASVTLTAEPSTWGIVGTHTNFFTSATAHTASGSVLGHPITVTFTPINYRWDYGDGSARDTATPGATWVSLGQDDFTSTATSHAYTEKATVHATVTVTYSAVVTLASGTRIPVSGTLTRASTAVPLELFHADTVITVGDCNEHPQQPRC